LSLLLGSSGAQSPSGNAGDGGGDTVWIVAVSVSLAVVSVIVATGVITMLASFMVLRYLRMRFAKGGMVNFSPPGDSSDDPSL